MKFIKKYENFVTDENRSKIAEEPEFNPVKRLAAKNYVDLVFNKGGGAEVNDMCKEIGHEMPKTETELDGFKEEAIKYFIKNPERIKNFDQPVSKYPYYGGSKVASTNNIGGTSFTNSTHVGESLSPFQEEKDNIKLDISEEEMKLFGTETLLINLIRDNKISLHDTEVWFNKNDEDTKKILDIFFNV